MDQNEEIHVVTLAKPIVDLVPFFKGKHFQGSSHGNVVGFVVLSPISAEWKETKVEKQEIFNRQWQIPPGGPCPGQPEADSGLVW